MREGESVHSDGAVAWVGDLVPGGRVRASPSGLARARGWGRMSVVGFPHQANAALPRSARAASRGVRPGQVLPTPA